MQLKINLNGGRHGGLRRGAGRKRLHSKGVSHVIREKVLSRTPLHVNFRYRAHVRNKQTLKLLNKAIKNARSHGLKVLHFSFQSNHVHLILEAQNNSILTRGMRSLTITLAKGLDMGRIQVERYHLHVLKTVREVKHALRYVLFNQQLHEKGTSTKVDDYSSLLSLKNALDCIRKFAKKRRITIQVGRGTEWKPDASNCFLLRRGLTTFYS